MNAPGLRCMSAALAYDRVRYRRARTRLAFAEGALVASLAEWAASAGEDRSAARHLACIRSRHVRTIRKQLAGIAATMRITQAQHADALAASRARMVAA